MCSYTFQCVTDAHDILSTSKWKWNQWEPCMQHHSFTTVQHNYIYTQFQIFIGMPPCTYVTDIRMHMWRFTERVRNSNRERRRPVVGDSCTGDHLLAVVARPAGEAGEAHQGLRVAGEWRQGVQAARQAHLAAVRSSTGCLCEGIARGGSFAQLARVLHAPLHR